MKSKMRRIVLPAILLLAFFLRVFGIDKIPTGFTPDEASFGYDAYSILTTGNDQWGNKFPVTLKSFGDYKSPLYAYLTIPSVAIFGLNVFAVRLPNAIIGTLAILATYLLCKEFFKKLEIKNWKLEILPAFLLAVSSWSVMMSRGAFEANLITFFVPLGIYLFLKERYNLSALVFGLGLLSYHSAKIIIPVVTVGLIVVFWQELRKKTFRSFISPVTIFILFVSLLVYSQILGGAGRINERIISQGALEDGAKAKIELIQKGSNPIVAKLLHNKYQVIAQRFITNYLQYFSTRFLFTKGPAETTYGMVPGIGVLYIFDGILLLGLIPAIFNKKARKLIFILIAWLLIGPVPAALATGVGFSANRAEGMVPVLQILEVFGAYGWSVLLSRLDKKAVSLVTFGLALLIGFELQKTFKTYFLGSPVIAGSGMLSGNLEASSWLSQNSDGKKVIVSRKLSEPQIYIAFINKWDPRDYQNATKNWKVETWVDQIPEYSLGKYVFKNIDLKSDIKLTNTLLVGRPEEFLPIQNPVKIIYFPDGSEAIKIIDTQQKLYASIN